MLRRRRRWLAPTPPIRSTRSRRCCPRRTGIRGSRLSKCRSNQKMIAPGKPVQARGLTTTRLQSLGIALPVDGEVVGELVRLLNLRDGVGGGLTRNVVGLRMAPFGAALVGVRLAAVARAVIVALGHSGLLRCGQAPVRMPEDKPPHAHLTTRIARTPWVKTPDPPAPAHYDAVGCRHRLLDARSHADTGGGGAGRLLLWRGPLLVSRCGGSSRFVG